MDLLTIYAIITIPVLIFAGAVYFKEKQYMRIENKKHLKLKVS
jgi:hypothetical protein